jgi:hypothetical protein
VILLLCKEFEQSSISAGRLKYAYKQHDETEEKVGREERERRLRMVSALIAK